MLSLKNIKNSVWIKKKSKVVIGLQVTQNWIKQVVYNNEQNKANVKIYKNGTLYQSDLKTIISDPKQQKAFKTHTKKVFESNPYWSIISDSADIESLFNKKYEDSAVNEQLKVKIAKFAKIITKSNIFAKTTFYNQSDIPETIKVEVLAHIDFGEEIVKEKKDTFSITEVSMDQFHTAVKISAVPTKIDQSTGSSKTYDFSKVKAIYLNLIKDVGKGKPIVKITSKNKALDYKYTQFVNSEKLIFLQTTNYTKKEYVINFDAGTITVNNQISDNIKDKNKLRDLIKQSANDLEKNKASVEGSDTLEARN